MEKIESAKIDGNNIFINKEKFEKSKYKILFVLCHYNTAEDNRQKILDQINSNISEKLNENDIAIYGFISDYEQKEEEKTDSKILEEIKGEERKMYTNHLKNFVLSQSPKIIFFVGTSFLRIINRKVEYNNQKIAFTKFLDEVGIRYELLRRDGKEDDNAEKYEIKYALYDLDVELKQIRKHLFSKVQRKKLDGLYETYMRGKRVNDPDIVFFDHLRNLNQSGLDISEDCFKGFRAYKRATYLIGYLLERMEKKAPEDDVDILNEILLKIEQAECFVPVSMLIEMVREAKINFEKATNVFDYYWDSFSGKKNRIHSYNEEFQNRYKNIVGLDSKCNRILNKLYKRLLEENDSTDACKIITERVFHARRKDELKIYQERNYPSWFSGKFGVKNVSLLKIKERKMIINNLWTPPKNAKQKN